MRKRVVQRIALAAILFLTGSVAGTIALALSQYQVRQAAKDQTDLQFPRSQAALHVDPFSSAQEPSDPERSIVSIATDSTDAAETIQSSLTPNLKKLLQAADRLAQQGNVNGAILLYEQISQMDAIYQRMNIRLRYAYCSELSTEYGNAVRAYQSIVDESADPRFEWAAQLGIARVYSLQGEFAKSHQILCQLFLNEASYRSQDQMRSSVMFALTKLNLDELARHFCSDQLNSLARTGQNSGGLDSMQEILALDYQVPKDALADDSVESRTEPRDEVLNEVEPRPINTRLMSCDISLTGANELSLLQQVADRAGLVLNSSDAASGLLRSQFQDVNCRGLPLELFLDALLLSGDIHWSIGNGALRVMTAAESTDTSLTAALSAAERLIRYSILSYPELEPARASSVDLANIEFWRKNFVVAIQQYRALLREPELRRQIPTIRFNMGIANLHLGDLSAAEAQFQQVIDNGLTEGLLANAHYHLGVIQLDSDRAKDAQRSFAYALNAAKQNQAKSRYCTAQASAYLAADNPYRALTVMEQHTELFPAADENMTAAFLVAFARYEILGDEDSESDQLLLSSLSHVDSTSMPGLSGYQLMSEAFHQLGLSGESMRSLEAGVQWGRSRMESIHQGHGVQARASNALTEMEFQLAERYATCGKRDAARALFERIYSAGESEYRIQSLLRLAFLAQQERQLDEAIELCRKAIAEDVELTFKNETLRLLGDVFQEKGNRVTAAMCYAGLTPTFEEL